MVKETLPLSPHTKNHTKNKTTLSSTPPPPLKDKTQSENTRTAWLACLLGHTTRARYASTISSCSHSVPLPLRSTSSGGIGMIVASEKMKGWM